MDIMDTAQYKVQVHSHLVRRGRDAGVAPAATAHLLGGQYRQH